MRDAAAPWLHALAVALSAAASYWALALVPHADRAVLIGALVFGVGRALGWMVRPKRNGLLNGFAFSRSGSIKYRQKEVVRHLHALINALAILKAEVDLIVAENFPVEDRKDGSDAGL
jgi:hypothetical protein